MPQTPKHIPTRTCIGCGHKAPRGELVRIVGTNGDTLMADLSGKRSGRGAYVCLQPACWEAGMKRGRLEHALRRQVAPQERQALLLQLQQAQTLRESHGH